MKFPSNTYPEEELLDHKVVLFLVFCGTSILFSIVAVSIYIPTNSAQGFPFVHIVCNICCSLYFDNSHSNRCEVIPHCGFIYISLMISDVDHLFMYLTVFV